MIDIRNKYHIALNDIGYVLQNAPESPAYILSQAALFNNRLAQGDRTYDDFAQWWYWAQTDWWNGFKNDTSWADDAKYYYSTNIDTFSEPGAIKLISGLVLEEDFTEDIWCGAYETVGSSSYMYIGTKYDTDGKARLYQNVTGTWSNIISGYIPATSEWVADMIGHKAKLWVITVGAANAETYAVFKCDADGANQTDYTADIATAMGWTKVTGGTCLASDGNVLYIGVHQYGSSKYGIVKTADAGTTWTKLVEFTTEDIIACMALIGGNIYYLIEHASSYELRQFSLADSVDISLQIFISSFSSISIKTACSRRLIHSFQGRVIITIPDKEIWEIDISTGALTRLLKMDDFKKTTMSSIAGESAWSIGILAVQQLKGGIIHDNKIWWGNLAYDGSRFYNTKKNYADTANKFAIPVFSSGTAIYWLSEEDASLLYVDSGYKGTADKNYLVFNNNDKISGVDKIAFSITLLFKKFAANQSIVVEYHTGELASNTTWTALGTASYTLDGASATQKVLYFPVNTSYKKIWIRVKLNSGGSDTPALYDLVLAYLPTPFLDKEWAINVDCGSEIRLLDNSLENRRGRELKGKLEAAWLTRQILDFQDVDYASTAINNIDGLTAVATSVTVDDTSEFPEQGRIRIENEIIYYTGKTPTSFTGLSRGQKGTLAVAHANDVTVHNGYKIMIQNFRASVPILNNDKKLEYVVALSMREII